MRGVRTIGCALALAAIMSVPSARADEYTKQTFLTFSGPVQLPGITLPAGTYMFKLADPESGRRTLQVWDKEGTKLYTMLLTIPDERMEASDKPVVMFSERPAGQPQAIRAWFYPDERFGQEFVYPKQQAMAIARENHTSVLSYDDDNMKNEDAAAMHSAKVGRIDDGAPASASTASTADAQSASTTSSSASTTSADRAAANTTSNPPQTSTAPSSTAAAANPDASSMPSANRTQSPAAVGTSGSSSDNTASPSSTTPAPAAVGTTGSSANRSANANTANRTAPANSDRASQSDRGANAAAPRESLPRTASSLTLIEMLSGLTLAVAFGARQLRKRYVENRA